MTKEYLIEHLSYHLRNSQKSERWAMYRLITPVVDYANKSMGLEVYFEFNQTSKHHSSQSVDIALLKKDKPTLMIEAKRINRKISAELITKYLTSNVRGIVTNGESWILCSKGKNRCVSLTNGEPNVLLDKLDEIVSFICNDEIKTSNWNETPLYYQSDIRPSQPLKVNRARRISATVSQMNSLSDVQEFIANTPKLSALDIALLDTIFVNLDKKDGFNVGNDYELRTTRASFFQILNSTGKRTRAARIEFGKKNPDVLILTELVDQEPSMLEFITSAPHDKGAHMRRFRPFDKKQTDLLGQVIAKLILDN